MSLPVIPAPSPGGEDVDINDHYMRGDSLAASSAGGGDAVPSLDVAKAYGRSSRPMRIRDPYQPSGYRLARIGEGALPVSSQPGPKAEPYAFWSAGLTQLDEFGIGVSLYFRQLAFLALVFLGAGLIYLPTMWYNFRHVNRPGTPALLLGSSLGAERSDLSFMYHGVVDLVVCGFLLCFAVASKRVEDAAAAAIDGAQQTTQDYSVEVLNPPRQIKDPEAFAQYFRQWGDVVFVTVALDNARLLRLLRRHRELRAKLQMSIDGMSLLEAERGGAKPETLLPPRPPLLKRLFYRLGLYSHASLLAREYLIQQQQVATEAAKEEGPQRAGVKRVYAVFNTEAEQLACLAAHKRGLLRRLLESVGIAGARGPEFQPGVFLKVREPVEPSEVRYEAFDVRAWERGLRYAIATLLSLASLGVSYALLRLARGRPIYTAVVTSGMNIALPLFMKTVVALVEVHIDQSDAQDSCLQKLVVARIFAVVVIKYLVTDYAATMTADTLGAIVSILIADALVNPLIHVLNVPARFNQWVLAPRAKTQREMNLHFAGSEWSLAERYTDLIKTAFLSLFWSSILPGGCFLTALGFLVVSFTDKYQLLYEWKRPPLLDSTLARRARNFLVVGVAVHVVMARVFYANWPFASTEERARCNVLFCTYRDWYTPDQARIVAVFTILGTAALALVVLIYGSFALDSCFERCWGSGRKRRVATTTTTTTITTSTIPFRALVGAAPFLPLVHSSLFPEPFFAFDVAAVPPRFLPVCTRHHHHHQQQSPPADDSRQALASGKRASASEMSPLSRLSLCSRKDLPMVRDARARAALFATVRYYLPAPATEAGSGASPAFGADGRVVVPNRHPQAPTISMFKILTPAQLQQPDVAVPLTVAKPLPPGWAVMVDSCSGRPYYYHEPTQTVQWDDPRGVSQLNVAMNGAGAA